MYVFHIFLIQNISSRRAGLGVNLLLSPGRLVDSSQFRKNAWYFSVFIMLLSPSLVYFCKYVFLPHWKTIRNRSDRPVICWPFLTCAEICFHWDKPHLWNGISEEDFDGCFHLTLEINSGLTAGLMKVMLLFSAIGHPHHFRQVCGWH